MELRLYISIGPVAECPLLAQKQTSASALQMSVFGGKVDMPFVVANSKIEVQNFRALFGARSLNRFF